LQSERGQRLLTQYQKKKCDLNTLPTIICAECTLLVLLNSRIQQHLCGQRIKTKLFLKKPHTIPINNPKGKLNKVIQYFL